MEYKQCKAIFIYFSAIIIISISLILLANGLILAWSSPGSAPPAGNVSPPLNISGTAQTKSGSLRVDGGFQVDGYEMVGSNADKLYANRRNTTGGGLWISDDGGFYDYNNSYIDFRGSAGIRILESNGSWGNNSIRATNLCFQNDCRSSWPSGGITSESDTLQSVTNRGKVTSQWIQSNSSVRAPIFYDSNNTGYYVNPNGRSNMERVDFSYGYDRNNTAYYIDLNNRTNLLSLTANGDIRSPIFYDQNNTSYYVDPASTSVLNRVGIGTANPTVPLQVNSNNYMGVDPSLSNAIFVIQSLPDARSLVMDQDDIESLGGPLYINAGNQGRDVSLAAGGGNVGIGVPEGSALLGKLHVKTTGEYAMIIADSPSSQSSQFRLYKDGGMKWAMYSPSNSDDLSFYSGGDRFTIKSDGKVGIGTTNPSQKLSVNGNANKASGGTYWAAWSDERLKTNINTIDNALDTINKLRGVTFEWKDQTANRPEGIHMGIVAQEVELVIPQWVLEDNEGYKLIQPEGFEGLIIEAIKELKADNDVLREEMNEQKAEIKFLKEQLKLK